MTGDTHGGEPVPDRRVNPDRRRNGPVSLKAAILSIAAILGALVAIWTQAPALWTAVGWVTPSQAGRIHMTQERRTEELEDQLEGQLKSIEDLIICDKYDVELTELLARQQAGDESVQVRERIMRLRELRRRRDCARFDE
jgi:hypothetical protein